MRTATKTGRTGTLRTFTRPRMQSRRRSPAGSVTVTGAARADGGRCEIAPGIWIEVTQ